MPNNTTDLIWLFEFRILFASGVTIEKSVFSNVPRWRGPKESMMISGAVEPRAEIGGLTFSEGVPMVAQTNLSDSVP